MTEEKNFIDFSIIWKKIHDKISVEEESQLSDWLAKSPINQQFFKSAIRYYKSGSQFCNSPDELKKAFKLILLTRKVQPIIRYRKLALIAGVAASILFMVYFHFFQSGVNNQKLQVPQQVLSFDPGSNKAVLILADGSKHDLSSVSDSIISTGGIKIRNTGKKLEYDDKQQIKAAALTYNTIVIPRGGEYFVVLSDGTKVWLNSESSIRFPVQFADDIRNIDLTGEAYFEVSKNANRPFVVTTGNQQIKVLGTQFNVSSYSENLNVYTTLVEGKVEISLSDNLKSKIILQPGEQCTLAKVGSILQKKAVDVNQFVAWKDGRFVFVDQPLSEIMKTLSKWYDVNVVFANENDRKLRFTGNLGRYANFKDILEKIERTNEVTFSVSNDTIMIK